MSRTSAARPARAASALLLVAALAAAPALAAPSSGDVEITESAWNPTFPASPPAVASTTFPSLILTALNTTFNANSAAICAAVKAKLTSANGIAPGFTAHPGDFVCNPGATPATLQNLGLQGSSYTLAYTITGNVLELTTTTPSKLGSYADPRFSVTFDMTLNATIPVPSANAPLSVGSVTVALSNASVNSQNLPAAVINAIGAALSFFGGPNFQTVAQNAIDSANVNLTSIANGALAQIKPSSYTGQGYTQISGSLPTGPRGPIVDLTFAKPIDVPTHGNASVPVTVEWVYGAGAPTGGCAAFSAQATVQIAPSTPGGPPMAPAGNGGTGSGAPALHGADEQCTFNVTGLPYGIPVNLSVAFNGDWNSNLYKIMGIAPYGEVAPVETLSTSSVATPVVFLVDAFPLHPKAFLTPSP